VTLGKTIGVSLFDDGVLAHNPRDVERQVATWDYPRWDDAPLPRPVLQEGDIEPLEEEWDRWAARVEHYLSRIEAVCKPDNFIVCGRASVSYDKWAHKMRGIETPVRCAKQGLNAAVQGAAQGAREILTLRRDTARVRAAIGHQKGLSPQKLTDDMLGAVFDEFDVDGSGALSSEELAVAISRLGVTMTDAELKELFVEMDSEMTGDIRRHEFINWWKDSIGSSSVEIIHTMEEYQQVMEDAAGTGQLTVLMVGVTYCKPCKAFSKKYGDFAERFSDARFIKVFGNENKDMTTLCRDELKVKSTPTFYFFRDDEQVHMHTGANAGKFEKFILENSRPGEPGYGSPRLFEDPVEDPKKDSKDKKEAPAR
jgi:thioredoxin 1